MTIVLPLLLVLALQAGSVHAQDAGAPNAGDSGLSSVQLAVRNRRTSFTHGAAERARRFVDPENSAESALVSPTERGAALIALGAGGDRRDVSLLESYAVVGNIVERRAAVFALGELGPPGLPALKRLLVHEVDDLEAALTFSLMLSHNRGTEEAAEIVRRLGAGGTGPLATSAAIFVRMLDGDSTQPKLDAIDLFFELRWLAACEYGFVDGRRWREVLFEELLGNDEFLDRVILGATRVLDAPTVRDHVVEMVRGAGSERVGVIRGAVAEHPDALGLLFAAEGWWPSSRAVWDGILAEVENQGLETQFVVLIRAAIEDDPGLADTANRLLLRGGAEPDEAWMARQLEGGRNDVLTSVLERAASDADPSRIPFVQELMMQSEDVGVRLAGIVALARLGHVPSREHAVAVLRGGPSDERLAAFQTMMRAGADSTILAMLDIGSKLADLTPVERTCILVAYARVGRTPDRGALHEWLKSASAPGVECTSVIRELARKPAPADIEAFGEVFPKSGGDPAWTLNANVELALALVIARDPVGKRMLHAALWDDEWNRSVLAGGLIWKISGMHSLLEELESPPHTASAQDMRRVGFAIGEWGGLPAVDDLALDRDQRDVVLQGALLGALSARGEAGQADATVGSADREGSQQ